MIKKSILILLVAVCIFSISRLMESTASTKENDILLENWCEEKNKSHEYFIIAQEKINQKKPKRKDLVIVIDYRKNLFAKRLYLLDMKNEKELISSTVAHAWNTGSLWANEFSNVSGSKKSSEGTFITGEQYTGRFGESMRIKGLDRGINDAAQKRAIVFHSTQKMNSPWSEGCFATPTDVNTELIRLTKGGCLVVVITQ